MAKSQQVATTTKSELSVLGGPVDLEELANEAKGMGGAGLSSAREDSLIPFLTILQDLSPQTKKRETKYIEGAEAGMILRTDIQKIYSGEEGVIFQPCFFAKRWVEWVPRDGGGGGGQGFVTAHTERPDGAKQPADKRNKWVTSSGNDLVETRYHYGNLLSPEGDRADPVVIGMTSSGHTVSRQWMALMNQFRVGGDVAPSFFRGYALKTILKSNSQGSWYIWKPEDLGWLSKPLRDLGAGLYKAISSGEKEAAHEEQVVDTDSIPF